RRTEDGRATGLLRDAPDVVAGERREVDLAIGTAGDPVRSGATWSIGHGHRTGLRVEATEHPALPREPERAAVLVEHRGVEVRVGTIGRQSEALDFVGDRVDPDDRVEAAVGDPRRAVRSDDHTVWRGSSAELDRLGDTELGIKPAELARELRGVPDTAVTRRRNVVRSLPARHRVLLQNEVDRRPGWAWRWGRRRR